MEKPVKTILGALLVWSVLVAVGLIKQAESLYRQQSRVAY
jgi:hypothetical protein